MSILDFDTVRNRLRALGLSTADVNFTGRSQIHVHTAGSGPSNQRPHSSSNSNKHVERQSAAYSNTINQAERLAVAVVRNALRPYTSETDLAAMEIEFKSLPKRPGT